jgi:Short repeat of unknown function (DUF308)
VVNRAQRAHDCGGMLAVASPLAAGVAVNLLVAWLLLFSGCAHLVFAWHTRSAGGLLWQSLLGVLYIFIGVYLLMHPLAGLASLTIALGIYLCLEAILEFILGFALRPLPGSGWFLFDRDSNPRCHDLENVAIEHGIDSRHTRGDQHAVWRHFALGDFPGSTKRCE